jgi:hypothetical protein
MGELHMNAPTRHRTPSAKGTGEHKPVEKMLSSELALAFGKECLGWKDAKIVETDSAIKIYHVDKIKAWTSFDLGSLESVMQAVREWHSANDAYEVEKQFEELFNFSFGSFFVGAVDEAEICRELVAACVEAHWGCG